jgi:hypothetical protein
MNGTKPPILHMPSWREEGELHTFTGKKNTYAPITTKKVYV